MAFAQASCLAGAWGLLPFAAPALGSLAARTGALCLPRGKQSEQLVGGGVAAVALVTTLVRGLGALGALATAPFVLSVSFVFVLTVMLAPRPRLRARAERLATTRTAPFLLVAAFAGCICIAAARLLPIWQWDSLGYHLPFVGHVLQAKSFSGLPVDLYYTSTYPHVVESLFVALRLLLPDDRLVDLGQCGLGLLGACAVAAIARHLRASLPLAIAAGAAWLLVPAVYLQLPTNYVDVGAAAFLLCASYFLLLGPTPARLLLAAASLGLYLGSKPSAPLATAVLFAVLVFRSRERSGGVRPPTRRVALVVTAALALVMFLGSEAYVVNVIRHGNPIWPAEVRLGPIVLAGPKSMHALLSSGANTQQIHGSWVGRIARSWTTFDSLPAFDMRVGGMGPLFVLALPFALVTFVRKRSAVLAICILASLASPDPALARYVLAFPAFVLALGACAIDRVSPRGKTIGMAACSLLGLWQIGYATPGLTGEGPPLYAYLDMTEEERLVAVGADGSPKAYVDARARIGEGESVVYDENLDLAYLAWDSAARFRSFYTPATLTDGEVAHWVSQKRAKIVIAGHDKPLGRYVGRKLAGSIEGDATVLVHLFDCKSAPCAVYERRGALEGRADSPRPTTGETD